MAIKVVRRNPLRAWMYRQWKYAMAQTYLYGWRWIIGRRQWNGNAGCPPGGWV